MPGPEDEKIKDFEEIEELAAQENRRLNEALRGLYKKAADEKQPETALYTAEGKLMIREARKAIRDAAKKWQTKPAAKIPENDSDMQKAYEEYCKLVENVLKQLERADQQLETYVTEKTPSSNEAFKWYRAESRSYRASLKILDNALENLNDAFAYEFSDQDDSFRSLYAQTANLHSLLNSIEQGNLNVPSPDTRTERGKKIHFVDTTKRKHQPLAVVYDDSLQAFVKTDSFEKSDDGYEKCYGDPLFSHDPCPEDVCQGGLGNCYMMSMLSAVAAQDPQAIKDAMIDHGKSVTVRFFNKSHEPVYVTVDKSVPGKVSGNRFGQPYSKGQLWVQLMEKAFAASGLMKDKLKQAEEGTYLGDHNDINSGYAMDFLTYFLGKTYIPDMREGGANIMIPFPNKEKNLTSAEITFLEQIQAAQDRGAIIYAGARFDTKDKAIQSEKTKGKDDFTGIYSNHAHSIHGFVSENDNYYIKVRNPHGHMGRRYQNGKPVVEQDAKGYNLVDIKMFGHYFDMVQYANVPMNAGIRSRITEGKDIRAMYGDAVTMIEKALRQTDAFYLKFKNSEHFEGMRKSSARLKELLSAKYPNPNSIRKEFGNMFKAANDYLNYRDGQIRDYKDELSDRAVNRYQIAEVIASLEKMYKNNPDMKKADLTALTSEIGKKGQNPSPAKKASVEVFERRNREKAEAQAAKTQTEKTQSKAPLKQEKGRLSL